MKLNGRGHSVWRWLLVLLVIGGGAVALLPTPRNAAANAVPISRVGKGQLVAWGSNSTVGIANAPQQTYPNPTMNADIGAVVAVGVGGYSNLALQDDGTLLGWGNNS